MTTDTPLVTVYIPTKNRAPLLQRAISSVFAQSYHRLELIVVDDGSTDSTAEVVAQMRGPAQAGHSLVYLKNHVSLDAPASRNRAIEHSSGEFITGLDDDDEFLPHRIQDFLDQFDARFSALSTCIVERGDDYLLRVEQPEQLIDSARIRRKNFIGNQVFTRTLRLRELGGFDEDMKA